MYVVTHNDQVLLGPINFNTRLINSVILDDTEILVSVVPSMESQVPLNLGNGIKIRTAVETKPSYNTKTHMINGPFWTFDETTGTASYVVLEKPLDMVRRELKEKVKENRYKKEVAGAKVTIQGQLVTVETDRDVRGLFVQQFLLLPENGITRWKFPEMWLDLTKADLGACVAGGVSVVQGAFDWESAKGNEIDAANTLVWLDSIDLEV